MSEGMFDTKHRTNQFITTVSGVPLSGTSMMMNILKAGSMDVSDDNTRVADEDHLDGCYEFENVKNLKEYSSWINHAEGKSEKIISIFLFNISMPYTYKIIFMVRRFDEILASQKIMLQKRAGEISDTNDKEMIRIFTKHINAMHKWLDKQDSIDIIYQNCNRVIKVPRESSQIINIFLGGGLDKGKMVDVVNKYLCRNRIRHERRYT